MFISSLLEEYDLGFVVKFGGITALLPLSPQRHMYNEDVVL